MQVVPPTGFIPVTPFQYQTWHLFSAGVSFLKMPQGGDVQILAYADRSEEGTILIEAKTKSRFNFRHLSIYLSSAPNPQTTYQQNLEPSHGIHKCARLLLQARP
jgi:hypothetical protein